MTARNITTPFPVFTGKDGTPLDAGYVFIGVENLEPITNPIVVYWDEDLTVPALQPIRTINGYPSRSGTPSALYANVNYSITVKDKNSIVVYSERSVSDDIGRLSASNGSSLVGFIQAGSGAVGTDVETILREIVTPEQFGAVGDGFSDDTVSFSNALAASVGKIIKGDPTKTYLITDTLVIPSNVSIDLRGATILDGITGYWDAGSAGRAKPLFYVTNVNDVSLKSFSYQAAPTRSTLSVDVPTVVCWIGDNRTSGYTTKGISVSKVSVSDCAAHTMFIAILGNSYNVDISDVDIFGDCAYGINVEYGLAPSGTSDVDAYGEHPYNINVSRFNGYDNTESVGFLRVASCYNVKFSNCYAKDVKFHIYCYGGDRNISRVSENVVFENCSTYASAALTGVNYCVQVAIVNKDGSTSEPLPAWTNYDHLFKFVSCQFQNNATTSSACLRFFGNKGITLFEACIFRDSYYGVRAEPSSNPNYTSSHSLTFTDCEFINNYRDLQLASVVGCNFVRTKFSGGVGTLSPVNITNGSTQTTFDACVFYGIASENNYITIDATSDQSTIRGCVFSGISISKPVNTLSATYGSGNKFPSQGLAVYAWATNYSVIGEPTTEYASLADVPSSALDVHKATFYCAETGAVSGKNIEKILNGRVGDVVVIGSVSPGASVVLKHLFGGVATLERLLNLTGADETKTGIFSVAYKLTPIGWLMQ